MVTRAAVVSAEKWIGTWPEHPHTMFRVHYRILKRGKKPLRYTYQVAVDELDAFMRAQDWLRQRGYKV